jgi:uncharacterized coiled-coil protein SlyX
MDERVMNLEVKLAFQEHQIGELNEVIREMADAIEELKRDLGSIIQTVNSQQELGDQKNERPPHY